MSKGHWKNRSKKLVSYFTWTEGLMRVYGPLMWSDDMSKILLNKIKFAIACLTEIILIFLFCKYRPILQTFQIPGS